MKNFKLLGRMLRTSKLLKALRDKQELWDAITIRQEFEGTCHSDTKSIILRGPVEFTPQAVQNSLESCDYTFCHELHPELSYALSDISNCLKIKEVGRYMLVNLLPDGHIKRHSDEGLYAEYYDRLHLVVQSKPGNEFVCGDESVYMKPGELWWFNHRVEHEVFNRSDQNRIHLIMDVVPWEKIQ